MIIYFSSTGNSKRVAKRIAEATEDWTRSITTFEYREGIEIKDNGVLGIVCPTYFSGIPVNVQEFISKIKLMLGENVYVFFVATYGGKTGRVGACMEEALEKRGVKLDAKFSVKMVDNWTPMFDVSDNEKNLQINKAAEPAIDMIIEKVKNRVKGDFIEDKLPGFIAKSLNKKYDSARKTSNFHVEDRCVKCMLCVKRCPSRAIEIRDNKPYWIKDQCVLCLGCLHRCPKFAIQYGSKTKTHGQYRNEYDEVWEN